MNITKEEKFQNLEVFNNFIGYGNPESKYWFIAIEEHSPDKNPVGINWELEKRRLEIYKQHFRNKPFFLTNEDFRHLDEKIIPSPTYEGIKEIHNIFNRDKKIELKDIGEMNSGIFISNLYPLGRATTNDNYNPFVAEYIFNGNFGGWYNQCWINNRRKNLISFLKNYLININEPEKYLFCLGTTLWNEFQKLLKVTFDDPKISFTEYKSKKSRYGFIKIKNCNIYCLYHPASSKFRASEYHYLSILK